MSKLVLVALLAVLLAGCPRGDSKPQPGTVAERPAAGVKGEATTEASATADVPGRVELQILDFDGIQRLIAGHRGRVVVMDAWSTSCAPCVKEFPKLVALSKRYGPDQLRCISLSFDFEGIGTPEEQRGRVQKFLERQGATFDNVLSSDESDALYRKLRLASIPAVYVYDRSGKLRRRFDNESAQAEADNFSYEQVGALVAELVAESDERPGTAGAAE